MVASRPVFWLVVTCVFVVTDARGRDSLSLEAVTGATDRQILLRADGPDAGHVLAFAHPRPWFNPLKRKWRKVILEESDRKIVEESDLGPVVLPRRPSDRDAQFARACCPSSVTHLRC